MTRKQGHYYRPVGARQCTRQDEHNAYDTARARAITGEEEAIREPECFLKELL